MLDLVEEGTDCNEVVALAQVILFLFFLVERTW